MLIRLTVLPSEVKKAVRVSGSTYNVAGPFRGFTVLLLNERNWRPSKKKRVVMLSTVPPLGVEIVLPVKLMESGISVTCTP
jgi:hypothetical protein